MTEWKVKVYGKLLSMAGVALAFHFGFPSWVLFFAMSWVTILISEFA